MGLIKRGLLVEKGVLYMKEQMPRIEHASITESQSHSTEVGTMEISDEMAASLQGVGQEEAVGIAQNEAEEILRRAMEEAEAIKENAKITGFEEAKRLAEEGASDKVKEALETINQAIIERKKIIKDAESEVLRIALKVSEQIIRSEVSMHRDVALNIVADAITRVSDREQVIVRVNKEDVENIKRYKDRIGSAVDGIKSLSIVEDGSVEAGGCIIETNLGYVDARISTKLAAIEEAFRKAK